MSYQKKHHNADLTLTQILRHDTKEHTKARGILSRLLRVLMWDWGIDPTVYKLLMDQWLNNAHNGVYQNSKDRATARGNINKEFARTNISWSIFMKALRFHRVWRVDIRIICWRSDKLPPSYHKFNFQTGIQPPKTMPTNAEIIATIEASERDEVAKLKQE